MNTNVMAHRKQLIEPIDEYYGYMGKYYDVCNDRLDINFPESRYDDIYEIGEEFNPAEIELVVTYSDGTTETITEGYTIEAVSFEEPGEHTVEISYNGESDYIDVWVNPPITEAEILLKKAELTVNNHLKLSVFNLPKDMSASDLNWTSSNESVVTVTNGIVSEKSAGTAIITVSDNLRHHAR